MTADPLVAALKAALPDAMRARDTEAASALRTALAAVANAEAVAVADGSAGAVVAASEHVAGAAVGLGAAEASRRDLSGAEVRAIVEAEVHDRLDAASGHDSSGQTAYADRLRREAAVLQGVLDAT